MPIESYATLLNLRKILPSTRSNYVAVDRDYWIAAFSVRIGEVALDQEWYLKRYPDVANAIKGGILVSALEHYCHSGYFEHRMPYKIDVEAHWYLNEYPDVQAAMDSQLFGSAQEHFEEVGFHEGRCPYPGFALRSNNDSHTPRFILRASV